MTKQEQVSLLLKAIGLLQGLPVLVSHVEEASALKQALKLLHDDIHREMEELINKPQLTGEDTNVTVN